MPFVGINIGAVTVKWASLDADRLRFRAISHQGQPLDVVEQIRRQAPPGAFFGVSGSFGHLSEVAAVEAALEHVGDDFDAVASLGGEAFAVYLLRGARISNVLSDNRCAAGSGEFLVQQVARLGVDLETAIERSFCGEVIPLASRCSVHCKSDIIHKLNRREANVEDILHTLHASMAGKVVALLEKGQRAVRRLLIIGGLARNRALIAALRDSLPDAQVVVLPESHCFEALGTALLTRAKPLFHSPKLALGTTQGAFPALTADEGRVTVVPPCAMAHAAVGPLVLGVDVGSTTTKAVLLDGQTREIAAADYRRTNGNPLEATRQCLRALAEQVGNETVRLIGTTGSARELIGAYLGTTHVYNEISAHAVGAARHDPGVNTIFEIGGQDSKYILLRNGVPIDYAMNAACSAGTGSFLEECALSDLGIPVSEIAELALRAAAPVRFKASCAAFINTDIRSALQGGSSREDVVAGLVYSIVENYLNTVKGHRAVGTKVFLQGGVAMNRAVAHAFAQRLGKQVVVPPHPELMGAIGVALLALEKAPSLEKDGVTLASLWAPAMQSLGQFTCRACGNGCMIERFEVAGRRFPFGGRCSLYESLRNHRSQQKAMADLVGARNQLLFAPRACSGQDGKQRIGIPRALTTHGLYPLYATLFERLGMEVELSGIESAGLSRANSAFCYPVQIAHGAVLDLVRRGVKTIFLPHVDRMPKPGAVRESYLCPITQASPYFISKAFSNVTFLSPVLKFGQGYETCRELVQMACRQFGISEAAAENAYREAVESQLETERAMRRMGQEALDEALRDGGPTIILVGRSYNAFPAETSQSVGKKLASMGVRVIPCDCLPQNGAGPTSWHYPNMIMNSVELVKRHPNLFLLYVSNFSCTIDAFTHSMLASELGAKPYLLLEIDAHTADAGIQTRLEAFLGIIESYQGRPAKSRNFAPASLGSDGVVTTSAGQRLTLADPRVKLYFPILSHYHARAAAVAIRSLGLSAGRPIELTDRHLELGLQYTSGRECLPVAIAMGQMLEAYQQRQPGEIVGFYMISGGAPCVADCYLGYFQQFIEQSGLEDLFLFAPRRANNYYGLNIRSLGQVLAPVITLADLFIEMEQGLKVVGAPGSRELLRACWSDHVDGRPSLKALRAGLESLIDRVAAIPHADPSNCPKVIVTGDVFTRLDPAFMKGVHEAYARHGILLIPVGLSELFLYGVYDGMASAAEHWGVPPESLRAMAMAGLRVLRSDGREYLANWVGYHQLLYHEQRYRKLFRRTGLLTSHRSEMGSVFRNASDHISPMVFGEAIPTVGRGVLAGDEGYHGILVIGPFNCLPFRISEAILKPLSIQTEMPILTYESDGFPVTSAFLRQVDVHVQQVLARWSETNRVAASP